MATGRRFGDLHRLVMFEAEMRRTIERALYLIQDAAKDDCPEDTRRSLARRAAEILSPIVTNGTN